VSFTPSVPVPAQPALPSRTSILWIAGAVALVLLVVALVIARYLR
jgi:hypothetical protein